MCEEIKAMISAASLDETFPAAHSAISAAEAFAASAAVSIFGSSKETHRSRLGATSRSRHIRRAVVSPSSALSINLRVIPSTSPSRSASAASVAWLRDPFGLPFGLPLCPGGNGRPRCFEFAFSVESSSIAVSSIRKIYSDLNDVSPLNQILIVGKITRRLFI